MKETAGDSGAPTVRARARGSSLMRDLLLYSLSKAAPAVMALAAVSLLTNTLSPEQYGKFALIVAFGRLGDSLGFGWLRQSTLRYYQELRESVTSRSIVPLVGVLTGIVIGLQLIVSLVVLHFFQLGTVAIVIAALVPPCLTLFNLLATVLQARCEPKRFAAVAILQSTFYVVGLLALIHSGEASFLTAVLIFSGSYFIGAVSAVWWSGGLRSLREKKEKYWDRSIAGQLVSYGIPMSIWLVAFQFIFFSNRFIIQAFRSSGEVGIYSSAHEIFNGSVSLLMTPLLLAAHPIIMREWGVSRDLHSVEKIVGQCVRLLVVGGGAIVLAVLAGAGGLISSVLGKGFGVDKWVGSLLVLSAVLSQAGMYAHKGLELAGNTGTMARIAVTCVLINLALTVGGLQLLGLLGVALAAVMTYMLYIVLSLVQSWRIVKIRISMSQMVKIIGVIAGLAGGVLYFSPEGGLGFIALGLCVMTYIVLMLALGVLKTETQALGTWMKEFRQRWIAP